MSIQLHHGHRVDHVHCIREELRVCSNSTHLVCIFLANHECYTYSLKLLLGTTQLSVLKLIKSIFPSGQRSSLWLANGIWQVSVTTPYFVTISLVSRCLEKRDPSNNFNSPSANQLSSLYVGWIVVRRSGWHHRWLSLWNCSHVRPYRRGALEMSRIRPTTSEGR